MLTEMALMTADDLITEHTQPCYSSRESHLIWVSTPGARELSSCPLSSAAPMQSLNTPAPWSP
jgi:hypothetical protein